MPHGKELENLWNHPLQHIITNSEFWTTEVKNKQEKSFAKATFSTAVFL